MVLYKVALARKGDTEPSYALAGSLAELFFQRVQEIFAPILRNSSQRQDIKADVANSNWFV